jgi:hypothetical protein
MNPQIRPETSADQEAIRQVNRLAFGQDAEARLVDDLRDGGYVQVSLVAENVFAIVCQPCRNSKTLKSLKGCENMVHKSKRLEIRAARDWSSRQVQLRVSRISQNCSRDLARICNSSRQAQ